MGRVITQADVDAYHAALGMTGGHGGGGGAGGFKTPSTRGLDNIEDYVDLYFFAKDSCLYTTKEYQCKWCFNTFDYTKLTHNRAKDKRALPSGVFICPKCGNIISCLQYRNKRKVTKTR